MAASPRFGRVVTAMVTPFDDNLLVDENVVTALVNHLATTGMRTGPRTPPPPRSSGRSRSYALARPAKGVTPRE